MNGSNNNTMQHLEKGAEGAVRVIRYSAHDTRSAKSTLRVNGEATCEWPFTTERPATDESMALARRVFGPKADISEGDFATMRGIYTYDGESRNAEIVIDGVPTHEMFITTRRDVTAYAGVNNFDIIEVGGYKIIAIPIGRVETATIYGRDY